MCARGGTAICGTSREGAFTLPDSKGKNNAKNRGHCKTQPMAGIRKESACFFCKKKGHMKDYAKHKAWLEKKGTSFSFVCYESNFTNVNHNTLWIDFGSTIHVSNILQGMRNLRKPVDSEQYIHSGGRSSSHVEAIGTYSLKLSSGFVLQLEKTFYVPSFSRNLFSISALLHLGISYNFMDTGFVTTPEPDPTRKASPNRHPGDARFISFIFCVIKFSFSKMSRPESLARPEWRIRTGARFTPTFSFILSKYFINLFSCGSGFIFGQAHHHLKIQNNSVGP